MRLALVATPAALPDLRPTPGSLDGDTMRARLPLPDAAFRVVDLDPAIDLAEQMENLFEGREGDEGPIFFYASCRVILSAEGELFLSFDPSAPDTGDSLGDLALVFREHARGPVAFVVECRHAPDPEDPFRSAAVVSAAKEAVKAAGGAVELLVAANPVDEADTEDRPSGLTRALIEALDDPESEYGLTLGGFSAVARESPDLASSVRCFAHVKGPTPFALLPERPRPAARRRSEPVLPPASDPAPHQVTLSPGAAAASPAPGYRALGSRRSRWGTLRGPPNPRRRTSARASPTARRCRSSRHERRSVPIPAPPPAPRGSASLRPGRRSRATSTSPRRRRGAARAEGPVP